MIRWLAVFAGVVVLMWIVLAVLASRMPPGLARDLTRFIPDCVTTVRRLRRDPAVPRSVRIALLVGVVWVLSPIDLIPEFLPVIGPLDDVLVIALVLRFAAKRVPREVIEEAWPGDPAMLQRIWRT